LGLNNGWQTRFHDHIIRNDIEYQKISEYIINNPANWKNDKFYEHTIKYRTAIISPAVKEKVEVEI